MGTRGFTGWKIDGKITLTYQQYDSYPSGVGVQVLTALTERMNALKGTLDDMPDYLRDSAAQVILGAHFSEIRTYTESARIPAKVRAQFSDLHDPRVSTGEDNYSLLRGLQGDLGQMLDRKIALKHDTRWAHDSLFCEWGYLVNFSLAIPALEVYQGFQKTSPTAGEWTGRKASMQQPVYGPTPDGSGHAQNGQWGVIGRKRGEYFPVNRVATFPLVSLPADPAAAMNQLEASLQEQDA